MLFNRIAGRRIAIVDEAEGVTRDRLYSDTDLFGRPLTIIDTGGIDPHSKAQFSEQIRRQAEIAIEEADGLIMVVDAQVGICELDREVARILQRTDKPLVLAVNKVDGIEHEVLLHEFYGLGIERMEPCSAAHNRGNAEVLEAVMKQIPRSDGEGEDCGIKVALVGRPNVGKSTLLNQILCEERSLVSPIPGTTRDSIDVGFMVGEQRYTLIDTAGIRRKPAEKEVVDKFAAIRTEQAIERADICLLMLDARKGLTSQEKRIASAIEEQGKGCVLLFNKWDMVQGFRMEHCLQALRQEASFLNHCPALCISAKKGRNVKNIFPTINEVHEQSQMRVGTGELNRFLEQTMQRVHPPMITGKRLKVYYMAQVGSAPPSFVLFVNRTDLMTDSYHRYLYNQFRKHYAFTGVPLNLQLRARGRSERANSAIR